jgi:dTMP kinase
MFVTLEGIDGAGKTTVVERMREEFKEAKFTREPTGSWLGDAVERAVTDEDSAPLTDLFLFAADHADHLDRVVRPALNEDGLLICDRYVDSRYAYQGATLSDRFDDALGWVRGIHEPWTVYPDLTLLLDVPAETALRRKDAGDKYERVEFLRDVAENYRRLAENEDRFVVVDASREPDAVAADCIDAVRRRL